MCWLFAASSASSAIVTTHSLLSAHTFILLLTSLSFSVYFGLSCLLTLSIVCCESFYWFLPFGLQGFMILCGSMVSSSFVDFLEPFLQPRYMPSPSLGSHALFLHLPLLIALHPQATWYLFLRAMVNVFKMFSFFSLVVSYLTLIPFCSLFGSTTPIWLLCIQDNGHFLCLQTCIP